MPQGGHGPFRRRRGLSYSTVDAVARAAALFDDLRIESGVAEHDAPASGGIDAPRQAQRVWSLAVDTDARVGAGR